MQRKRGLHAARGKSLVHFPLKRKLHTDILEEKYGPISAKVLGHDNRIRESHLVDAKGISRTFALTFFPKGKKGSKITAIDSEIRSGKPIGKTFREHGFEIRKNVIHVFVLELPDWLRKAFMHKSRYAKARLSEFYAKNAEAQPIIYGTVLEVYSPDFRPPSINEIDMRQVNAPTELLEKNGFSKKEIWERAGKNNDWRNARNRLKRAKAQSTAAIQRLERRIKKQLAQAH